MGNTNLKASELNAENFTGKTFPSALSRKDLKIQPVFRNCCLAKTLSGLLHNQVVLYWISM